MPLSLPTLPVVLVAGAALGLPLTVAATAEPVSPAGVQPTSLTAVPRAGSDEPGAVTRIVAEPWPSLRRASAPTSILAVRSDLTGRYSPLVGARASAGTGTPAATGAQPWSGRLPAGVRALNRGAGTAAAGMRTVDVALVVPKGAGSGAAYSRAAIAATLRKASDYWSSQTGGRVTFTLGEISARYTSAYGCEDIYGMWNEARGRLPQSADPMHHLMVLVPGTTANQAGCQYGYGTVESGASGGSVYVSELSSSLFAHELGHNLGLNHANSLVCAKAADARFRSGIGFGPTCEDRAYDDLFDVMGYSGPGFGEGNLDAVHLAALGLTASAVGEVASASSTITLKPLSQTGAAARAYRIADPAGATYFVEYRTATGRDAVAADSDWLPQLGVRVLRADPHYADESGSYELDATPGVGDEYDRALPVGRTFTSASGRVKITVVRTTGAAATVRVSVSEPTSSAAATSVPSRVAMTAPSRAAAGARVRFVATVSNAAGLPVSGWPVTLQRRLADGTWISVRTVSTAQSGRAVVRTVAAVGSPYRWRTAARNGAGALTTKPRTLAAVAGHGLVITPRGR